MDNTPQPSESSSPSSFTLIYITLDSGSAHIAQTLLESQGIPCTIEGEIINQVMIGYQGTTWIRLYVPQDRAAEASQLLRDSGFKSEDPDEKAPELSEKELIRSKNRKIIRVILLILLVLLLLALYTYYLPRH